MLKKSVNQEIEYFNEDEIKQLKDAFKGHKFENLILMALGTGLRQGELLALKWRKCKFSRKIFRSKGIRKKSICF